MKRPFPFHPILLGLVPVLFAYAHNIRSFPIHAEELVLPVVVTLVLSFVVWALTALLLRNWTKGAIIASLFLLLFFLYGHVQAAVGGEDSQNGWLAAVFVIIIAVGSLLVVRARGDFVELTVALNAAGSVLVLMNLVLAVPGFVREEARRTPPRRPMTSPSAEDPNIYYIILDTYTRSDYLWTKNHCDNTDFLDELKRCGFMVAELGRSNYRYTYASLASSLNFTYLDSVARIQGPASLNATPLIQMIEHSRLADFLKRRGYDLVTFASGYTGTELGNADVRMAPLWQLSELQNIVLGTTMLSGVMGLLGDRLADRMKAGLIRYTLQTIPRATQGRRRPAFVFAHVLCPHGPYVFEAVHARSESAGAGSLYSHRTSNLERSRAGRITDYGLQVQWLDGLLRETVERILADSTRPSVIILQGDHGNILLPGQFANLNAIRVPPGVVRDPQAPALYDSLTPVNTFRVLLSQLFDSSMALLPDYSYFNPEGRPYDFQLVARPEESELQVEPERH